MVLIENHYTNRWFSTRSTSQYLYQCTHYLHTYIHCIIFSLALYGEYIGVSNLFCSSKSNANLVNDICSGIFHRVHSTQLHISMHYTYVVVLHALNTIGHNQVQNKKPFGIQNATANTAHKCITMYLTYSEKKGPYKSCNFGYEALKNEAYKVLLFMTHLIPILKICISKKVSLSTLCFCYAFSQRIHFLNGSEVSLEAGATFEKPHLSRTKATLLDSIFPQSFTLFWLHWVFRLPFFWRMGAVCQTWNVVPYVSAF